MTSGINYDDIDMEYFENETWMFNIYLTGEGRMFKMRMKTNMIKSCFNKEEPAEYLFCDKSFLEIFVLPFLEKTSIN